MNYLKIQHLQNLLSKTISITDDKTFHEIMKHIGEDITIKSLSDKFGVARSSINRWVNGQSVPHPATRPRIYTWLRSQVKELLSS